jgi:hypothetical protein
MRSGILTVKALAWSPAASPQTWRKVGITRQTKLSSCLPLSAQDPQASFLDHAFENRADGTAFIAHYLFACAGVRTANGQIHAVTNRIRQGNANKASAIIMSFPSIVDGKPLFSHRDEKLEFRFILNQRVFEITSIVNSTEPF